MEIPMKNHIVAAIILIMTLAGCGGEYPRDLVVADSIADGNNPKMAIDMLDGLRTTARSYSPRDKYYYELLKIKAADKAYIKHTSDSMILEIIDYYEGVGDKSLLPMAYYYGGRVYRKLGDAPQALSYFQKCMEHPLLTKELRALLFIQMGDLYLMQNAYDLAIETQMKSYEYCREVSDSAGMVYPLIALGHIYKRKYHYDSAEIAYNKALELAANVKNDARVLPMVHSQLTLIHLLNKDLDKAKTSFEFFRKYHSPIDSNLLDIISLRYYARIDDFDSLMVYCNKLLKNQVVVDNEAAYKHLMRLARKERDIDAMMIYLDSFLCYKDSVAKIEDAKNVRLLKSQYDYSLREKENARLESERNRWQIMALICGLGVVVLVAIVWIYKLNYHRNKVELELAQRKICEVEEALVAKARAEAEQSNQRVVEVDAAMVQLRSTEIYAKLLNMQRGAKAKISDEDWDAISRAVNEAFPQFDEMLNKFQYKLSKNEYRMTLLLKMQFPIAFIADLLHRAANTISTMRKRVYERAFLREGDSMAWDDFVARL